MKICIKSDGVAKSLPGTAELMLCGSGHTIVPSIEEAQVVVVCASSMRMAAGVLQRIYRLDKFYMCLYTAPPHSGDAVEAVQAPPNVLCQNVAVFAMTGRQWTVLPPTFSEEQLTATCKVAAQLGYAAEVFDEGLHIRNPDAGRTALVVDGVREERNRAADALGSSWRVVGVANYAAARRMLTHFSPDVMMTDLYLPRGDLEDSYQPHMKDVGRRAPLGLVLANHARAMGAVVTIVSDADPARDPVAALLTGGGYPQLMYNTKKDWGAIAKMLAGDGK